ncbi:MAG TPA: pitrilysin family protein [Planctomycetota bacterium]|nr:pitrilysin family protein [Planctomycetota bacterium]
MSSESPVPFEKLRLDNGVVVILHQDRRLPTACVNLWYHVGAKDEPAGRSGFAHLFEHLMFMGTRRAPQGDFDRIMEGAGGQNNATTSEDRTNYFSWGPSTLLPTLLWLEADRLEDLGAAMTQEKLDLQRDVVRNERRQSYENEPYGNAELEVNGLMFAETHPYHLPVIGSHADLEAATVDDVREFFATYYVPNNLSIAIAGDFDRDATLDLVSGLFGTLPRGAEPLRRDAAPARLGGPIRRTVRDPAVEFARTSLIWHSPALFAAGDAECDVMAKILGDGISSRLQRRLMVDELLVQSAGAWQQSMQLGSLFRIDAVADEGVELARIEAAVDETIRAFLQDGPTAHELERVKAQSESEHVASLQRLLERADRLNLYDAHFGDPDGFDRDVGRYRRVSRESVMNRAAAVLDPNARLTLHVLPEEEVA